MKVIAHRLVFREAQFSVGIRSVEKGVKKPTLTVRLEEQLPNGTLGTLTIFYRGEFERESTEAFFKSSYTVEEKKRFVIYLRLPKLFKS